MIRILRSFTMDAMPVSLDHRTRTMKRNNSLTNELRNRKEYGCADEEALNYDPKTQTPMILAVGRLSEVF